MGLSCLNVYVSGEDDPCSISSRTWYVTVYDCDGNVFSWCDKRYVLIPAPCGHVELKLPPGCYYLKAVWSYYVIQPGVAYRVNHFTDAGIVTLCCDTHQCIKLFNPSAHRCGTIYVHAVQDLVNQKVVKPRLGRETAHLIGQINEQVGKPQKPFELGHQQEIDTFMLELAEKAGGRGGKGGRRKPPKK